MIRPGKFITVEGGEGTGKSTLIAGLETHLLDRGQPVIVTREPGGTPLGRHFGHQCAQQRHGGVRQVLAIILAAYLVHHQVPQHGQAKGQHQRQQQGCINPKERAVGQGATHILCHIQVPGAVNLETRCEGVTDGATEHLLALENLRRLNLSHTVVTREGIAPLRQLPKLDTLGLDGIRN